MSFLINGWARPGNRRFRMSVRTMLGLVLVIVVLVGHERLARPWHRLADWFERRAEASRAGVEASR